MSIAAPPGGGSFVRGLALCLIAVALLPLGFARRPAVAAEVHLLISEVMTGGASASDELIELYNPSAAALPIEGLELVYVSASGVTLTRRVGWEVGAPLLGPGAHLLVANEAGTFAAIADAVYAGGMAATGGSVALRIQGATAAVDAVGWGDATGAWLEGHPASAPPAGASIERLPGGSAGSTTDTDDNAADFVVRSVPDPENTGSPPVAASPPPLPTATPIPSPTATAAPSDSPAPSAPPVPTNTPAPTASPTLPIGTARGLPDGTTVTIEATALTGSAFTDGGGYLSDATGGIAVLLDSGSFARGERVLVTGTIDDRFAQRTLRSSTVAVQAGAEPPTPVTVATGAVNEVVEGRLVRVAATIDGGPTTLSGGLAFDVDDGSGVARVVVGSATGIDVAGWVDGRQISLVGVVGQRDSSGTGASGYRVQPREPADVELLAPPSPTPTTPRASESPQPTSPAPSPSDSTGDVTMIATARAAASNAQLTVRGVVTLASGTIEDESAVIQDSTGAILLRLGEQAGPVVRGELVEVDGVRSTKSGMESMRVTAPPRRIGTAPDPAARVLRTGDAGEGAEAELVLVRGTLVSNARRASSGTVSFEIDDGSGQLRVVLGASLQAADEHLAGGSRVEVTGVLGQDTTGAQPTLGYRVWPRDPADVRVLAAVTDASDASIQAGAVDSAQRFGERGGGSPSADSLAAIGVVSLADLRVGATLVTGAWEELAVAGLLWDGERLVGVDAASDDLLQRAIDQRPPPIPLELSRLVAADTHPRLGVAIVMLGEEPDDVVVASAPPAAPLTRMPGRGTPAAWVSIVGTLSIADGRSTISVDGVLVAVERLCSRPQASIRGVASVRGVALSNPAHIIVPCDGIGPAPALVLPSGALPDAQDSPRKEMLAASEVSTTAGSVRQSLVVALLAAGVAALLFAAFAGRRLGRQEGGDMGREEVPEVEEAATGPQLTLVRVPDEHGP